MLIIMLSSLFFSTSLEHLLKLKPDTSKIVNNSLTVHFVDVGQGDATLIRFPNNKTMLIDSGPVSHKNKLFSYINNVFFNGYKKQFDFVMLTHSDLDHAGNMLDVLKEYRVITFIRPLIYSKMLETSDDKVFFSSDENYGNIISYLKVNNIKTMFGKADVNICDDTYDYMRIFGPVKSYYNDENCFSPIATISHNNVRFMFTGDATINNETEVVNNYNKTELESTILKLGHHGSNTSTGLSFLETINPEVAVISVGKNNSYLHPSDSVINNITSYSENNNSDLNNNILQTQYLGNIIISVSGNNLFNIATIKNVDDYIFVSYWVIILIIILLFFACIIIPLIYKTLNEANKKIL